MKYTKEVEQLIKDIDNGEQPTADLINFQEDISCSDGFTYGVIEGGYIKPEMLLEGDDLIAFNNALKIFAEVRAV